MFNFFVKLNGFAYMLVCASAITHISRQGLFNLFLYQVELIFSCFSRHIITHVRHSTIKPTRGSSFYCLQVFGQVGEVTNVRKLLLIWSVMASNNSNNFDIVTFHMLIMESIITDSSVVNEGIKVSQIENFFGIGLKSSSPNDQNILWLREVPKALKVQGKHNNCQIMLQWLCLCEIYALNIPMFCNFFNCYCAAPWPTLDHSQGDSLTNLMLITLYNFNPKVTGSLIMRLDP